MKRLKVWRIMAAPKCCEDSSALRVSHFSSHEIHHSRNYLKSQVNLKGYIFDKKLKNIYKPLIFIVRYERDVRFSVRLRIADKNWNWLPKFDLLFKAELVQKQILHWFYRILKKLTILTINGWKPLRLFFEAVFHEFYFAKT